jgi:hypothetical protein
MASENEDGWRTIDTAPKDGKPILLWARHIDATAFCRVIGMIFDDEHTGTECIALSFQGQGRAFLIPKLWQPLPDPPALTKATA